MNPCKIKPVHIQETLWEKVSEKNMNKIVKNNCRFYILCNSAPKPPKSFNKKNCK